MSQNSMRLLVLLCALAAAGCSGVPPKQRMADRLAQYVSVAGAPVDSFRFWSFYSWEPLGRAELSVWTKHNEVWLLRVSSPCSGLEFANAIGLSSSLHTVYARFDSVRFERQWCRITEIRPVDAKALRAARQASLRPVTEAARPAG